MPKELTHWYLAEKVAHAILTPMEREDSRLYSAPLDPTPSDLAPSYPALARCIRSAPHTFLLGAVGPDYLFYYLKGPEREAFQAAAMVLHGRDGGNTLRPLVSAVEAYGGRFDLAVGAFLLGYLAHVAGDAVFHPLVLYSVGKGQGRSQYEHHVFESALDLYVLKRWGNEEGALPSRRTTLAGPATRALPTTLKELTSGMTESGELSREEFLRLLGVVSFLGAPYSEEALRTCLRRYEILQNWFWSPLACLAARVLMSLNRNLAFLEASCYQRRFYRYSEAFAGAMEYRHPVTGETRKVMIEDLVKETVEKFLAYAPQIEELFQKTVIEDRPPIGSGKQEASGMQGATKRAENKENADKAGDGASAEAAEKNEKAKIAEAAEVASHPKETAQPKDSVQAELAEILEGFRSLQGPNLETGIQGDRADRILYVREEGLAGLFGPYGYRYP